MGNNNRRFTPEEDAFIKANYRTMLYKEIALKLGRAEGSVATRIKSLRLQSKQAVAKKEGSRVGKVFHPRAGVLIHIGTYGKSEK